MLKLVVMEEELLFPFTHCERFYKLLMKNNMLWFGENKMVVQLFMSHTKKDEKFCDKFDVQAARVGVKVFRSEFEEIKHPAWKTIKKQMDASTAIFLLVGKQLVKSQAASEKDPELREEWKHTQNWIAYEIGLACERGIDVWVLCENVDINFPVPYFNNYAIYGQAKWIRGILEDYIEGETFPYGKKAKWKDYCPYKNCGAKFNMHSIIEIDGKVVCPTCLRKMVYKKGHLL